MKLLTSQGLLGVSCLISITLSISSPTVSNTGLTTPVTFRPIGRILFSGKNYIIPILLDVEQLFELTQPIVVGLQSCEATFNALIETISSHSRGHPNSSLNKHFPHSIRDHIKLLLADLSSRTSDLNSLLVSLDNMGKYDKSGFGHRSKRGLINGIGELSSYLFGLVDAEQYEETQSIVSNLEKLTESERDMLNIHSNVLNVTVLHLDELEKKSGKSY